MEMQKDKHGVRTEAETGAMYLQAQEHRGPPEAGESQERLCHGATK